MSKIRFDHFKYLDLWMVPKDAFTTGWISIKEKDIPEGITVNMKNELTGKVWQDFRYSSLPKPYQLEKDWITHWMPLPKPPNNE